MAEFDIGKNCALKSCKTLDFLPFKCDGCGDSFCAEHYKYVDHACPSPVERVNYVKNEDAECPMCHQIIIYKDGEDVNDIVYRHMSAGCQKIKKPKRLGTRCSRRRCKVRDLVPIHCKSCSKPFCSKHYHENTHFCEGPITKSETRASAVRVCC